MFILVVHVCVEFHLIQLAKHANRKAYKTGWKCRYFSNYHPYLLPTVPHPCHLLKPAIIFVLIQTLVMHLTGILWKRTRSQDKCQRTAATAHALFNANKHLKRLQ